MTKDEITAEIAAIKERRDTALQGPILDRPFASWSDIGFLLTQHEEAERRIEELESQQREIYIFFSAFGDPEIALTSEYRAIANRTMGEWAKRLAPQGE